MDFHTEQLVVKKKTAKEYLFAAAIALGTVILWFLILTFLGNFLSLAAILVFGVGWGAFWLVKSLNVEYEYELTNHYLDIDKIMGQA